MKRAEKKEDAKRRKPGNFKPTVEPSSGEKLDPEIGHRKKTGSGRKGRLVDRGEMKREPAFGSHNNREGTDVGGGLC